MTIAGIALFVLLGQLPPPPPPPPPPPRILQPAVQPAQTAEPASIEGVVSKAMTGESLAKVTVMLTEVPTAASYTAEFQRLGIALNLLNLQMSLEVARQAAASTGPISTGQSRQTVTTASDGRFQFENVKPGTYLLKATLGGYTPAEYGQRGPNGSGMAITVKSGQKMKDASLAMMPGGSVTGRIIDANGEPASRALVQAHKLIYSENGRALVTVQAVPTDDRGEYRLFWLPPGKYYISATPTDDRARTITTLIPTSSDATTTTLSLASASVYGAVRDLGIGPINGVIPGIKVTARTGPNGELIEEAAAPVFYPAAFDVSAAIPVEVRPAGIVTGIDIATRSVRVYRIRGTVIHNVSGTAISPGDLSLLPRSNGPAAQPNRIPQGSDNSHFEIAGVLPGAYNLIASGTSGTGPAATGILPIEIQNSNLDNVVLTARPPFAISGRLTVEGTIVNPAPNRPAFQVQVQPLIAGPLTGSTAPVRDDSFLLPAILPGEYRIRVITPPDTYVKSIRFGAQDALRDNLHIEGPTSEVLEVVVRPNAGRLEGNVTAGRQKLPNAMVILAPGSSLRQQTALYQTAQTNAEGHFTFSGIAPGSYKVFAWEDIETFAWLDAEFMKAYESSGTDVLIREGDRENIDVSAIRQ